MTAPEPPAAILPHELVRPCDRLYEAAGEWLDCVQRLRDHPEIQGSLGELLLRTLLANPAVYQVEYARRAYAEARGWR